MRPRRPRTSRKDATVLRQKRDCPLAALRLCAIFLLLAGCKPDEPKIFPPNELTVEFSVDRETIHIGDPVEVSVTAYFPTNGILEMPEIGREKEVVLLKRDWRDVPREDGLNQSEYSYSLTSFRLGEHIVTTGMITCVMGDQTLSTNFPVVTLNVDTSLAVVDSSEIADIKPIHNLPGRIPPLLWISLGTALGAFLIGLISSRLWKHRAEIIPLAPPVPAHLIALKALEALEARNMLEQDECKPFYTELSLILRSYLEGRFQLNAPDETTDEIVEELSRSPDLSGIQRNILQDFMRQADMVKFAKGHPDRLSMESAFDTTKQFVEETKLLDEVLPRSTN
jgi:hypothetical protein